MTHILVYNGYKTGCKWHNLLKCYGAVFVGWAEAQGYAMWLLNGTVPAACADGKHSVFGELWVLGNQTLRIMDDNLIRTNNQFSRQVVKIIPLQSIFSSNDPFLVDMYVWTGNIGKNDSLKKSGVY